MQGNINYAMHKTLGVVLFKHFSRVLLWVTLHSPDLHVSEKVSFMVLNQHLEKGGGDCHES